MFSVNVLVTGGAGFIGSHIALALVKAGHSVTVIDDLSNSSADNVSMLFRACGGNIRFREHDVRQTERVQNCLQEDAINAVIHLAASKSVPDSISDPIRYYDNNVGSTISLLSAMRDVGCRTLVFSSSAAVYGTPRYLPIDELHPRQADSPYGQTKIVCEDLLTSTAATNDGWKIGILRYFNPLGANIDAGLGEAPRSTITNIMPLLIGAALGTSGPLQIFGTDYDTEDGSCVRDYIHVDDLAEGHIAALRLVHAAQTPVAVWNLGTGTGVSVRKLISTFERVNGVKVPHHEAPRRGGDSPACYANADKAWSELDWRAERSLEKMCSSSWSFARSRDLSPEE